MLGPDNTSYASGLFTVSLEIPLSYPEEAPVVEFLSPIFHPNVCCFVVRLNVC